MAEAEPAYDALVTAEDRQRAEQAIPSFGRKLDEFAAGLSERERVALGKLLFQAMGPMDRVRWGGSGDLLTEQEKQLLQSLSATGD